MVERDGIAKTEAQLAGAQRYSHSMGSIGQWLWTLLTAITSVMFFTNAVAAAKYAKAGLGG